VYQRPKGGGRRAGQISGSGLTVCRKTLQNAPRAKASPQLRSDAMDVIKAEHNTTFEVIDLPAGYRRRPRILTEGELAAEKRIKPAESGGF
jgi:hypothetical protein